VFGRSARQPADTRGYEMPATGSPSQRFHVVRISLLNSLSHSSLAVLTLSFFLSEIYRMCTAYKRYMNPRLYLKSTPCTGIWRRLLYPGSITGGCWEI
jgi:hypothetical protein